MQLNTLSVSGTKEAIRNGNIVADMREADGFIEGFIPGSLFLYPGLEKSKFFKDNIAPLAQWVLLCPEAEKEIYAEWLSSVTGGKVNGWLPAVMIRSDGEGGFDAWKAAGEPLDMVISIEPDEFMMDLKYSTPYIADLRSEIAFQQLHLEGAENILPAKLADKADKLPADKTIYLYCEDGRMSLAVISLLKRQGYHQFYHLRGGIKALYQAEAPMVKK